MSSGLTRRGFLRGKFSSAPEARPPLRPPWALATGFEAHCTRCGECARVCPTSIIRQGDGGYPVVDFARGECTFCGECTQACQTPALAIDRSVPAWQIKAHVRESCLALKQVECRVCGEQCAEEAIRFIPQLGGTLRPELIPSQCNGCGACVAPCPVGAIHLA